MKDCAPISTLLIVKHDLTNLQSPSTEEELSEYLTYANSLWYLEIVGSLLYVTQTQPDIQFVVGLIAQFRGNPRRPHLKAVKQILHYLKGTANMSLTFGCKDCNSTDLVGWTDSNWAHDPDLHHSVGGFTFEIASGSISWSSKKQPTVALSTVEAEYMAASNTTKEAIWL
jgi:hypothetical protein